MNILGISCYFHDSAACLLSNGELVGAAQEERFTRKKHDPSFPENAIQFVLAQRGLEVAQLDYVVFYDKPLLKFDRMLETCISVAPKGFQHFRLAIPLWIKEKLFLKTEIVKWFKQKRPRLYQ